tara:strand:+ start:1035 stop:1226 length:192 start_codon:yes stop_codon:yes gene_type:complete
VASSLAQVLALIRLGGDLRILMPIKTQKNARSVRMGREGTAVAKGKAQTLKDGPLPSSLTWQP